MLSALSFSPNLRQPPPYFTLFPYTTLFRSPLISYDVKGFLLYWQGDFSLAKRCHGLSLIRTHLVDTTLSSWHLLARLKRSEEHTSELQSRGHLVCRLLLEKKK